MSALTPKPDKDEPKEHATKMSKVSNIAVGLRYPKPQLNATINHHKVFGLDGYGGEYEHKHRIGEIHTECQ